MSERGANKEITQLRRLLKERTDDIAKVQPDPAMPRLSAEAIEFLEAMAEVWHAMAASRAERIEATALEMLVSWQRSAQRAAS